MKILMEKWTKITKEAGHRKIPTNGLDEKNKI
jgi:hypothetical protein